MGFNSLQRQVIFLFTTVFRLPLTSSSVGTKGRKLKQAAYLRLEFDLDFMNPRINAQTASKQHWPAVTCQPRALFCDHFSTIAMFLAGFAHFSVWNCNIALTTALFSSVRVWNSQFTCRRGQGPLNRDRTVVADPYRHSLCAITALCLGPTANLPHIRHKAFLPSDHVRRYNPDLVFLCEFLEDIMDWHGFYVAGRIPCLVTLN